LGLVRTGENVVGIARIAVSNGGQVGEGKFHEGGDDGGGPDGLVDGDVRFLLVDPGGHGNRKGTREDHRPKHQSLRTKPWHIAEDWNVVEEPREEEELDDELQDGDTHANARKPLETHVLIQVQILLSK